MATLAVPGTMVDRGHAEGHRLVSVPSPPERFAFVDASRSPRDSPTQGFNRPHLIGSQLQCVARQILRHVLGVGGAGQR